MGKIAKSIRNFAQNIISLSKHVDFTILITYVVLCLIGLVMIYSASMVAATRGTLTNGQAVGASYFFVRQLFTIFLSFGIVFFLTYFFDVRILKNRKVQQMMIVSIMVLLVITRITAGNVNGAYSWLNLGFMQFQTSELLKIIAILYLAYIYDAKTRNGMQIEKMNMEIFAPLILLGVCCGLVWIQNDTGTTMLVVAIIGSIFLYSGIAFKALMKVLSIIFLGGIAIAFINFLMYGKILQDYQLKRFTVIANPFSDEAGDGYHLSNSLLAIGNGGLFGKGLGNGVMKLGYLPEPHTDFIFAVISEELGWVGVIFIISLLFYLVYRGFMYAALTNNTFYKLTCVGVSSYIGIQAFINLGGISGLIPLTGVPLPFLSYGGSSLISLSIAIGLLLLVSKHINDDIAYKKRCI
ncbi:FtsW/RodA/SpoVE family cell cycle protein [Macrococcus sp. DPC7161]|uniref:FtsW/RodA/SpoVE family cell cycle protein n=1 Tax=Macrococcus sp. DPC7161 TaxID=2507060 RepID=UPI001F0C0647|nr:FtsW/RodA/SpoVE family cell cycle protein [Macrococcus sp. DPC7161]